MPEMCRRSVQAGPLTLRLKLRFGGCDALRVLWDGAGLADEAEKGILRPKKLMGRDKNEKPQVRGPL